MKRRRFIAALAAGLLVMVPFRAEATLPVIDYTAIIQAIAQTLKQIQQYAQQVTAYELQLQQYMAQLKNLAAPVAYLWQTAAQTVAAIQGATQFFQGNTLQNYLNEYHDYNYWMSANTSAYQYNPAGSMSQKQANDALVRGIVQQQQLLQRDAANLQTLQDQAQGADGEMKALQAANQLAAMQSQQLMDIRAILLQQQQAVAAQMEAQANDEAMKQAANEKFQQWNVQTGSGRNWVP